MLPLYDQRDAHGISHIQGFKAKIQAAYDSSGDEHCVNTEPIILGKAVLFRVRFVFTPNIRHQVFIKFKTIDPNSNNIYELNLSCHSLCMRNERFLSNEGTWRRFFVTFRTQSFCHTFDVIVKPVARIHRFPVSYEDRHLIDCEAVGDDGSIGMHRVMLAEQSPIISSMLRNNSKEGIDRNIKFDGFKVQTLKNLKAYLYFSKLPSLAEELVNLMRFANKYVMDSLETKCVKELVSLATTASMWDMLNTASLEPASKLHVAILETAAEGHLDLRSMQSSYDSEYDSDISSSITTTDTSTSYA